MSSELFEGARSERGSRNDHFPPIEPAPQVQVTPLSFAQRRLWFLEQLDPGNPVYNMCLRGRLSGRLNPDGLKKAFERVVNRHQVLRTIYRNGPEGPVQAIGPAALELPVTSVQNLPRAEQAAELDRLIREETRRPFDLVNGPLYRVALFRSADDEHQLVVTVHHSIGDARTMRLIGQEVAVFYEAALQGRPVSLPDLPIQYTDFARWQLQHLTPEALAMQLAYWKQQLHGSPPVLDLPSGRPRPSVFKHHGGTHVFGVSKQLGDRLRALSSAEDATLFMTLLAAFVTLLHRYSGQDDILVGTPAATRDRLGLEGLAGFLQDNLVIRSELSGNPTFRQLLSQVRKATLDAYDHQDVPFEQLVEELQPRRDLSYTPLFQVMFDLSDTPPATYTLPGVTFTFEEMDNQTAKYDLRLSVSAAEQLRGGLEYNADLFDADMAARMVDQFQMVLEAVVADPDQRIDDLPLLSIAGQEQLLHEWNAQARDYPQNWLIHQWIEHQAEQTPDVTAVVFEGQELTYRDVNRRANKLAHHLRSLGVGPDQRVGVCAVRSLELVVALLAVLKAGGAYVPLDPGYPRERLAYMFGDANVSVLLTQEHLLPDLPEHGARLVLLEQGWEHESGENPANMVTGAHLAYMIYTSGSTGRPKGAMNTHFGILNRLLWMQEAYGLTAADRVLQKTPFSFDVSVWEFFWPLMTGATLVVARPGGHQDSGYLAELIQRERITTVHFVPAMLAIFLSGRNAEVCTGLKRVICSGEALPLELQQRFFARLGRVELHNLYGPTEAAVDVTAWACSREWEGGSVPIGRPIANTRIYLLDGRLQPVPPGVPAELYIAGANVGRGYWNRPDLTADRFMPDLFGADPGARMYRTGDLARYRPDGTIEYIGRIDHQVKIRGLRIELGEIEATVAQYPGVSEVVVIVREDTPGDQYLAAYLCISGGAEFAAEQLRSFLRQRLPEYMVPSAFITLSRLPLSPNGKLDRKALPMPERVRPSQTHAGYAAPQSDLERRLAHIWREVLHVDRVGVDDNFFDLGGHSLRLAQVHARLEQSLDQSIPMVQLFAHPTIRALTQFLARAPGADGTLQEGRDRAQARKELMKKRMQHR